MKYLFIITTIAFIIAAGCKTKKAFHVKDVEKAQKLVGLEMDKKYLEVAHPYLLRNLTGYDTMRTYDLGNDVFPALLFDPIPPEWKPKSSVPECQYRPDYDRSPIIDEERLPFASLAELGALLRTGQVTSLSLTEMYLLRIRKYDGALKSVITLLEERALAQATKMDEELQTGKDRGPLHGIPYGVKDLLTLEDYPTTWGSKPYRDQQLEGTAHVIEALDSAGAVLIAKLTSGALARGDVWFDGQTKNPWDTLQGASGSSAGSGAATAAGLVGFSIGTETLGSITSPSNRNGVTGLRPTYGRISRRGVMSLAWSMDKVGPICRYAEDCALVFQAIIGEDPHDPTLIKQPFCFEPIPSLDALRIAYLVNDIEKDTTDVKIHIKTAMSVLSSLGAQLIPDSMPANAPFAVFDIILRSESGAFFDELVRSGAVDEMVQQGERSRANSLRQSRFIPAVEYLQANRHRRMLCEEVDKLFSRYDVIASPTFGRQLMITNLTGHPVVTVPTGFDGDGHPTSMSFLGNLFDEATILRVAKAYQEKTDFAGRTPTFIKE